MQTGEIEDVKEEDFIMIDVIIFALFIKILIASA